MTGSLKIFSVQRYPLDNVPGLLQLSFLAGRLKDRVLFYSSGLNIEHGRFSILVLNPLLKFEGQDSVQDILSRIFEFRPDVSGIDIPAPLFSGWISYETVLHFVFSDSFIVIDNFEKKGELVLLETDISKSTAESRKDEYLKELAIAVPENSHDLSGVKARALISKKEYLDSVAEIRRLIGEGDVYQVNFTYPVKVETAVPSWVLFYRYLSLNHADYAAFINGENCEVLSISPECLCRFDNGAVSSFPIKGTIKKGRNDKENNELKAGLQSSEKDLAELAMIVDLVRNDIGKLAVPGSVKVDFHADIMELPTLFHLYSKISGRIEKNKEKELFMSLFPGGSITGAPKIAAMQIISKLEKHKRGIYTGAIGFTGFDGKAIFNIPIRTVQRSGNTLIYSTGGGITWNSDPEKEFEETLIKARSFLNIFEDPEMVFE